MGVRMCDVFCVPLVPLTLAPVHIHLISWFTTPIICWGFTWRVVNWKYDLITAGQWLTLPDGLGGKCSFDDILFEAQLNTGFSALLCLGEMVANDKPGLQDWWKITMRHSFEWFPNTYVFWMPRHKGDIMFKGNWILCRQITDAPDPLLIMQQYLEVCDLLFPLHPQL